MSQRLDVEPQKVNVWLTEVKTFSVRCSECGLVRYPTSRLTAEGARSEHLIKHHRGASS